jgi:hypothetical protein
MKKLILVSIIALLVSTVFIGCGRDKELDKQLGQQLDTLKCLTGAISLTSESHGYLFDRLQKNSGSALGEHIVFGVYEFKKTGENGLYVLTNPNVNYSLYVNIETPTEGSIQKMVIKKLCSD